MKSKKFKYDGRSRPTTDLYKENFNRISIGIQKEGFHQISIIRNKRGS